MAKKVEFYKKSLIKLFQALSKENIEKENQLSDLRRSLFNNEKQRNPFQREHNNITAKKRELFELNDSFRRNMENKDRELSGHNYSLHEFEARRYESTINNSILNKAKDVLHINSFKPHNEEIENLLTNQVKTEKPVKNNLLHSMSKANSILKHIPINDITINAVGIDLGTTQCCAAVNRKHGIETCVLDDIKGRLLPSYISFDETKVKCGQIVVNRLHQYAESTIFDVKRIIGKKFEQICIDESWPYNVTNFNNKLQIQTKDCNGEISMHPEEISAALLKHIKQKAEDFQGRELTEVVITVPAAFNEEQKNATKVAAIIAGWQKVNLLREPVAAAFGHFIDRPMPFNSTILLFDLGGGTLDVCIFKISKKKIKIISRSGDDRLGGRDFDNVLIKYFTEHLKDKFGIHMPERKKYQLMRECQNIKHNLTTSIEDELDVEDFDLSKENCYIQITREHFEYLAGELLNRIITNINTALDNINLTPEKMDQVLYIGGGCRMPMVKKLLHRVFPNTVHANEKHPDEVVAIGAAYFSYHLQVAERKGERCNFM